MSNRLRSRFVKLVLGPASLAIVLGILGCMADGGEIATLDHIWAMETPPWSSQSSGVWGLWVFLEPTEDAEAGVEYTVELYEKRELKASTVVCWTQPQLEALQLRDLYLLVTEIEYDEYSSLSRDALKSRFSVEVYP